MPWVQVTGSSAGVSVAPAERMLSSASISSSFSGALRGVLRSSSSVSKPHSSASIANLRSGSFKQPIASRQVSQIQCHCWIISVAFTF